MPLLCNLLLQTSALCKTQRYYVLLRCCSCVDSFYITHIVIKQLFITSKSLVFQAYQIFQSLGGVKSSFTRQNTSSLYYAIFFVATSCSYKYFNKIMINDSNLPSLSTYNYTGSAVFIDVLLTVQQVFICYSNVLHKMENSLKP